MKLFLLMVFLAAGVCNVFAQLYSGPAKGSIASGMVVTTDNFTRTTSLTEPRERGVKNMFKPVEGDNILQKRTNSTREIDNYITDPSLLNEVAYDTAVAVVLSSFNGIGETNSIPPDPYIAVGPDHIVATVNSRFGIWDKSGNLLKQIDAAVWFNNVYSAASPFDPKITYDHYAGRWIMVWLHQSDSPKLSYFFISVSDDSNPLGTWYNWAVPANTNGNEIVNNWADYQGVGYDKNAVYLTSNQFTFLTNDQYTFDYAKIRIIPKTLLYANTAGSLEWTDLWDINYPNSTTNIFNVRPTVTYDESSDYFLLHAPSSSSARDYVVLYNITDPLNTPVLEAMYIPVNLYYAAPNGDQLGGSTINGKTMLLEIGGSFMRNEPKVRNNYLFATHVVRNATSSTSSSLRYLKIDLASLSTVEDVSMGAPNFWYSYPAIDVDKDLNVAITYSRSANTQYAGAFYTYRAVTDAPGLRGSFELQAGKGNYIKDYGSERNRWGDYNGIWLDPSDNYSFWMFTEYASGKNSWGTWVGKMRIAPFTGAYPHISSTSIDYGNVQLDTPEEAEIVVANYGTTEFTVQSVTSSNGPFNLNPGITFPVTIATYDSLILKFVYNPSDTGLVDGEMTITTSEGNYIVNLNGYGYKMVSGTENVLYASSGLINNGLTLSVNKETAAGTVIGPSKFKELRSIAMDPKTNTLYGVNIDNDIVRVNAEGGDAYNFIETELIDLFAIAFDTSGVMYTAQKNGNIFEVNTETKELDLVSASKIQVSDMAFNPISNELWVSIYHTFGAGKDRLYKVDLKTGDTTRVGITGTGTVTNGLAFTGDGILYGISGTANVINNLIRIDTITATATVIGPIGYKNVTGLAHSTKHVTSVTEENITTVPENFNLAQNFPNPFNPSTVITYSLPEAAFVKVTIYNLLGETVKILKNADQQKGMHKLEWNISGSEISSGIYFYEVKAKGKSGKDYSSIKKMVLMK